MEDNNKKRPKTSTTASGERKTASKRGAVNAGTRPRKPEGTAGQAGDGQRRNPASVQGRPAQKARVPQQGVSRKKVAGRQAAPMTEKQRAKKKRNKILIFIAEIFMLLLLLIVFWGVTQVQKIDKITIDEDDIEISEQVKEATESGAMKGFRNIALFGVDSRDQQLDRNTRTDTMMVASINLDTKEVKLISVYRDTYLNLSTDSYNKANSAYAVGGAKQAISMLNMNLDMNITDFVTVGFAALIDVVDAVGGIEIDVAEAEIPHLNSYQISIAGKEDGTLNAAGEPNYVAEAGVDYIPVTKAGKQTLNGLQATSYCRIRYIGNDYGRTLRQRTVLEQIAKKAITLNPATLSKIAEATFSKIATSLELTEILELLAGVAGYEIGESSGFPFDTMYQSGRISNKGSCVVPTTLEENVIKLHEFFFGETDYIPSHTVKTCSQKIVSDTSSYLN